MRTRIQVSTDVAAFGIWDRGQPIGLAGSGDVVTLETLVRKGEASIVHLGGDCGGAVDVFVNEDIPVELLGDSTPAAHEPIIVVRSGALVIDGVEHFGATDNASSESSLVAVPNGAYRIRIRITKSEDDLPEPSSEKEIRRMFGTEEVDYFDKTTRNGVLLCLSTLSILPILLLLTRWFVAIPITLIVFLGSFRVLGWVHDRNPRYRNLSEKIPLMRLDGERPILVVQLDVMKREKDAE